MNLRQSATNKVRQFLVMRRKSLKARRLGVGGAEVDDALREGDDDAGRVEAVLQGLLEVEEDVPVVRALDPGADGHVDAALAQVLHDDRRGGVGQDARVVREDGERRLADEGEVGGVVPGTCAGDPDGKIRGARGKQRRRVRGTVRRRGRGPVEQPGTAGGL